MTQMQRQLRTAQRTLQQDAEWLGISLAQLLEDLEQYPLAHRWSTQLAYHVYRELAYA